MTRAIAAFTAAFCASCQTMSRTTIASQIIPCRGSDGFWPNCPIAFSSIPRDLTDQEHEASSLLGGRRRPREN
jgi:hypothetical protein